MFPRPPARGESLPLDRAPAPSRVALAARGCGQDARAPVRDGPAEPECYETSPLERPSPEHLKARSRRKPRRKPVPREREGPASPEKLLERNALSPLTGAASRPRLRGQGRRGARRLPAARRPRAAAGARPSRSRKRAPNAAPHAVLRGEPTEARPSPGRSAPRFGGRLSFGFGTRWTARTPDGRRIVELTYRETASLRS